MSNLITDIDNLKKSYREIFVKTSTEFHLRLEKIKPEDFVKFLNEDILKEIGRKWIKILESRKNFPCKGCASCCKLACSEFSPSELEQKAKEGDVFATQFTSVFIPYENEEDAKKIYPEYFELLKAKALNENAEEKSEEGAEEKVYFYHCPKVTEDNKCPDYENRPQICRDFPDNPIGLLPKTCGYTKWKEEVEEEALTVHSMLEIVDFYKGKLLSD